MRQGHDENPLNPVPWVVWLLLLPMVAIEAVVGLGGTGLVGGASATGWRLQALQDFAFAPQLFDRMIELGRFPPLEMARFVTYPFVHGNFTHAVFVAVFLLALGKMVAEIYRPWAVLVVFFGAAIAGALAYSAIPGAGVALYGGYPAVYGLIGAFTYLLWTQLAMAGANRMRAFSLIGLLLGIQLVFGVIFGGSWEWVADFAGFATGFLLSFAVAPGGWQKVLGRLRQR